MGTMDSRKKLEIAARRAGHPYRADATDRQLALAMIAAAGYDVGDVRFVARSDAWMVGFAVEHVRRDGFDPDQPRDEGGRFGEGGGGGSSTKERYHATEDAHNARVKEFYAKHGSTPSIAPAAVHVAAAKDRGIAETHLERVTAAHEHLREQGGSKSELRESQYAVEDAQKTLERISEREQHAKEAEVATPAEKDTGPGEYTSAVQAAARETDPDKKAALEKKAQDVRQQKKEDFARELKAAHEEHAASQEKNGSAAEPDAPAEPAAAKEPTTHEEHAAAAEEKAARARDLMEQANAMGSETHKDPEAHAEKMAKMKEAQALFKQATGHQKDATKALKASTKAAKAEAKKSEARVRDAKIPTRDKPTVTDRATAKALTATNEADRASRDREGTSRPDAAMAHIEASKSHERAYKVQTAAGNRERADYHYSKMNGHAMAARDIMTASKEAGTWKH